MIDQEAVILLIELVMDPIHLVQLHNPVQVVLVGLTALDPCLGKSDGASNKLKEILEFVDGVFNGFTAKER